MDTVHGMKYDIQSVQMWGKKRQSPVLFLQGVNDELNSVELCNRDVMLHQEKIFVFIMDYHIWLHQIYQNNLGRPMR